MSDTKLRALERLANAGDELAAACLEQERRRRTAIDPRALLVGPCGAKGTGVLHVLEDRRAAGELGGPRWEALCHRNRKRSRRLCLTPGVEPRWAVLRRVATPDVPERPLALYPADWERVGDTLTCLNCYPAPGVPWHRVRSGQLLALGMGIPNHAQTALFEGGAVK